MTIEEDIFRNYIIYEDKLNKYGFEKKGRKLVFEANFSKNDFKIVIEFDGHFSGKVFDLSIGEEYTNFRIDSSVGFSSEIREEFIDILTDIREKCSEKLLFKTNQARNIAKYIKEKYKDEPEFLWKNFPTYAIFRNKKNKKWYALIGTVSRNKVDKSSKSAEIVEIVNLKVNIDVINEPFNNKSIYEAYHMNKKNWISIIFDETLEDTQIKKLVDKSYSNI